MEIAAPRSARFSIGRAFKDSFRILGRNFLTFVILAIGIRLIWLLAPSLSGTTPVQVDWVNWPRDVVRPIMGMIISGTTEAMIVCGALETLYGRKGSIENVKRGLFSLLPVVIASAIYHVPSLTATLLERVLSHLQQEDSSSGLSLIAVGLLLMVAAIGSMILTLAWCLYVPAIVVERKGVFASLARSAQLTKGRRWAILGLFVLALLIGGVAAFPVAKIGGVTVAELLSPQRLTLVTVIGFLGSALFTAFSSVLMAVTYYWLRSEKEGLGLEDVGRVFD